MLPISDMTRLRIAEVASEEALDFSLRLWGVESLDTTDSIYVSTMLIVNNALYLVSLAVSYQSSLSYLI